ncbi:RNA demethylase ALKBH10B isoform X2 [Rhodamnia argentea]|uniref:RNA demethylase ALKBH10B isoform X2 n=1 Tax=Rhodamnia argentea TaxID=178133 RepID=A0A8B8MYB6_9MYRT|nr:RNA demethylase ALKBH10B isoform X2 [Rhodamnia argentea]
MPMAVVGPASPTTAALAAADRAPPAALVPMLQQQQQPPAMLAADALARDSVIAWFRGEFAAANAIIDALCGHLAGLSGGGPEYEAVFAAVHRRRMNWIPVLQMQKYHSIADVAVELDRVASRKKAGDGGDEEPEGLAAEEEAKREDEAWAAGEKAVDSNCDGSANGEVIDGEEEEEEEEDSPDSDITDSGSHEMQPALENLDLCSNHELCEARAAQIKLTKGFTAKEPVKGHMVNVVKGLKLYENVFTDSELSKLTDFVNDLRVAGQNGELSGETYILFNKQMKGNKRESIQFGVPIFGHIQEEATCNSKTGNIEPIPALLEHVIDHLVEWQLIPVYKKPNSCIINFFDEEEYSQPFLKPPHLDQPIASLLLSESTMVFGRFLVSDNEGNYKGPLMLPLKEGSLLVMRGNSADMARHVTCPSSKKRVTITFFRVRPDSNQSQPSSPLSGSMTLWQAATNPTPFAMPSGGMGAYEAVDMMPKWGVLRAPVVMLAPVSPMVLNPKKIQNGGTGVFLPWALGTRKPAKHLPPRAQKGRHQAAESSSRAGIGCEGNLVST